MARTYKSILISRHRSAVRAAIEHSWSGAQPLDERKLLKKHKKMCEDRFLSYAKSTSTTLEEALQLLRLINEVVREDRTANKTDTGQIPKEIHEHIIQFLGSIEP